MFSRVRSVPGTLPNGDTWKTLRIPGEGSVLGVSSGDWHTNPLLKATLVLTIGLAWKASPLCPPCGAQVHTELVLAIPGD